MKVNYLNDEERKNHLRRREKKKDVKEEIRPRKKKVDEKVSQAERRGGRT